MENVPYQIAKFIIKLQKLRQCDIGIVLDKQNNGLDQKIQKQTHTYTVTCYNSLHCSSVGEKEVFSLTGAGTNLSSIWKIMKPDPKLILYLKYYFKWIIDLHVKSKIINLLEENIGEYLHNLGISKDLLNITQKVLTSKEKIDKLDLIKIN